MTWVFFLVGLFVFWHLEGGLVYWGIGVVGWHGMGWDGMGWWHDME
jgi:hypothetical protein